MHSLATMIAYLLIPVLLLPLTSLSADTAAYPLLQVEDGDTLVIEVEGKPTRVQLLGIDAPEDIVNPKLTRDIERTGKNEDLLLDLGRHSTLHLQQLIGSATNIDINANLKLTDKYGRIPVVASLPGAAFSLNAGMVQQGYAVTLPGNQTELGMQQLEEQARKEGAGLWGSNPELMQSWSGRAAVTR